MGVETRDVRVLVLTGYGLNCEVETAAGFSRAGATVVSAHLHDVLEKASGKDALSGYHILAFVGGFSFGDHIQSGRVYANRLRFRLGDALCRFVDDGGLALGICNGFQTLVCLGLLPALGRARRTSLAPQSAALVHNDRLGYFDTWVKLLVDEKSPCVWTRGLPQTIELPSRHGEGKLLFRDEETRNAIAAARLVPVRYADACGQPTEVWPSNPNGSPDGAAGLCDATGRIFGLMPHPDAFLDPENHPDWIRRRDLGQPGFGQADAGIGQAIFDRGVRAVVDRS
jgi:phosphoribosylformylglycinamidine (FGAM) synthase-like amidotransferase family enzyme